jgi:hypothetical protein
VWDFTAADITDGNDDGSGQGTHIAGTIGGASYGVAKGVTLHSVKVLDASNSGTVAGLIEGIDYVTNNHQSPAVATIGYSLSILSQAVNDAISASTDAGVLYAVPGGDLFKNACDYSPGAATGVVTVATSAINDEMSFAANTGACIDVIAPGIFIKSTWHSSDVANNTISHSPMAAAHVAGVAALIRAADTACSPTEVKDRLLAQTHSNVLSKVPAGTANRLLGAPTSINTGPSCIPEPEFMPSNGTVLSHQKLSNTNGGINNVMVHGERYSAPIAIGDMDGDGINDMAVGARGSHNSEGSAAGGVWIQFMNSDATVKSLQKISDTQGNFSGRLDANDLFGRGLANLGDLDGDGVTDIAVGSMGDDDGEANKGAVWILFLNSNGTVKSHQKISATQGNFHGELLAHEYFGSDVTNMGDLNGDGVIDIAVGQSSSTNGGTSIAQGAVWVLFLNSDGTVKSHQKIGSRTGGLAVTLNERDRFGTGVANIGDVNGDGIVDLAVTAETDSRVGLNKGSVWVLFLNTDGTVKSNQRIASGLAGFSGAVGNVNQLGSSVAGLGDLDGDGIPDMAVGIKLDDDGGKGNSGAVSIMFLNTDGSVKAQQKISNVAGTFDGELDTSDQFGVYIANLGDINGDGVIDIAVGADQDSDGTNVAYTGSVWILYLAPKP